MKTEKSMTNKKDKGGWLFGSQSSTLSLLTSSASPQVFFSPCGPKKQARKAEEALLFLCVGCLLGSPLEEISIIRPPCVSMRNRARMSCS